MQDKEREEFFRLHAAQAGKKFNFQQDLYNNCLSDVEILKNGCLLFRKLVLEITKKDGVGIDPFLNCVTFPSACHLFYRQNFMIPKSIALIQVLTQRKTITTSKWINAVVKIHKLPR